MVNRLDSTPDISQIVREMELQVREIKTAQIVGSDAVKTFFVQSPNAYDKREVVQPSQWVDSQFTIRFTPKSEKSAGYKIVIIPNKSNPNMRATAYAIRKKVVNEAHQDWTINYTVENWSSIPNSWGEFKVYILATGDGTLSVV